MAKTESGTRTGGGRKPVSIIEDRLHLWEHSARVYLSALAVAHTSSLALPSAIVNCACQHSSCARQYAG